MLRFLEEPAERTPEREDSSTPGKEGRRCRSRPIRKVLAHLRLRIFCLPPRPALTSAGCGADNTDHESDETGS